MDEIAEKLKEGEIDVAFTYDDDYGQPYLGPNGAEGLKKVLPFFFQRPCTGAMLFAPLFARSKLRNRCGKTSEPMWLARGQVGPPGPKWFDKQ